MGNTPETPISGDLKQRLAQPLAVLDSDPTVEPRILTTVNDALDWLSAEYRMNTDLPSYGLVTDGDLYISSPFTVRKPRPLDELPLLAECSYLRTLKDLEWMLQFVGELRRKWRSSVCTYSDVLDRKKQAQEAEDELIFWGCLDSAQA